jgi:tetratricopeptide (TPR) repeat protein
LLEAAVAADPDFVEAWAYLNEVLDFAARTVIQNEWFGETEAEREASFAEIRQAATRALEKAVALDPDNIETLLAQASDYVAEQQDPEYRAGRKAYIDRAIELEPDNAFARYVLAWWFRIEGNDAMATTNFLKALELDPEGNDAMATTNFLKALELDPFHAGIVTGSLFHFRSIGDEEMTARLFERLGRIAPEKSDDRSLAEISSFSRIDNLMAQFVRTADESILERYAEELARSAGAFDSDIEETMAGLRFLEFQGDVDGMLAASTDGLPDTKQFYDLLLYFFTNEALLTAQRLAGRSADAEATALKILDVHSQVEPPPGLEVDTFFDRFTVLAYATLNDDRASEFAEALLGDDGVPIDQYQAAPFVILSHVDPERAVQLTLANRARHPAWHGPDIMAAAHVWARNIIVHPDMQRYYVEEGKWVDYLAERVPEYAQYKR